jgi:hypothetical protein
VGAAAASACVRASPEPVNNTSEATCAASEQQDSEQSTNRMRCFRTTSQKPSRCFSILSALPEQISPRPCSWSRHTRRNTTSLG